MMQRAWQPGGQGAGIAHVLLRPSASVARAGGRRFPRLNCMSERPQLRLLYEGFGFRHHGHEQLDSLTFDRFELDLGAPE